MQFLLYCYCTLLTTISQLNPYLASAETVIQTFIKIANIEQNHKRNLLKSSSNKNKYFADKHIFASLLRPIKPRGIAVEIVIAMHFTKQMYHVQKYVQL